MMSFNAAQTAGEPKACMILSTREQYSVIVLNPLLWRTTCCASYRPAPRVIVDHPTAHVSRAIVHCWFLLHHSINGFRGMASMGFAVQRQWDMASLISLPASRALFMLTSSTPPSSQFAAIFCLRVSLSLADMYERCVYPFVILFG